MALKSGLESHLAADDSELGHPAVGQSQSHQPGISGQDAEPMNSPVEERRTLAGTS
jgi:hypothetical protein